MNSHAYNAIDFSPHLFWDVNPAKLDLKNNKRFIIERVIQRGSLKDLNQLLLYYGKNEIKENIKQLPWLNEKDMAFVHVFFNIPFNEMKCFIKRQSGLNY